MPPLHVVILAAGKGTRMKSVGPKVLHRVAGRPMVEYVLNATRTLAPETTTIVVGHQADVLAAALTKHPGLTFVVQERQLGTGHALLTAEKVLQSAAGMLVLLSGDVPLLSAETLKTLAERHSTSGAAATILTATLPNPQGYGRVVRSGERIARIVEEKDASASERAICEVNAGVYAFTLDGLFDAVRSIAPENAQNEYYLPDLVGIYRCGGRRVETVPVGRPDEILGINSRSELAAVSRLVRQAKRSALMAAGVTIEDPETAYIDDSVQIGADTIVHPCVFLEGDTAIGAACEIHSGVRIVDSRIGDRVTVHNHSVITRASIENDASVGPFAHLRNQAVVGERAKVGNFVEIKKTVLGRGSKAMHLAYLGDAIVGSDVNVGAGTITCNYDGVQKHTTTIEEGAFIGSDTQLVAPVKVGKGAYVGTGATIREDVPPGALAVSAGKQRNIEGWVEKKRKRRK